MSISAAVRLRVTATKVGFFAVKDFPENERQAVERALQRLVESGELVRVRPGLFYRGKKYSWGMASPDEDSVLRAWLGASGFGPAGFDAANRLGLTTQVAARTTIAVVGPKPRDTRTTRFVSRAGRTGRVAARLTPREVAMLEVLGSWEEVLDDGPADATEILAQMVKAGEFSATRLAKASVTEPASVRERLRVILERAGELDLAQTVPTASKTRIAADATWGMVAH